MSCFIKYSFKYAIILLVINSFSFIKSSGDNNDNKKEKESSLINKEKDCKVIEECHFCSFSELKTNDICQINGYKKKLYCSNEDKYYFESCNENTKINSVYIFLFICIAIFICSYRYQKIQKDSNLKNLMVKLSILKT